MQKKQSMDNKVFITIIFVLACEFIFFNTINSIECQFIIGLLIGWLGGDFLMSLSKNDYYKDGYYQEYHTSSNNSTFTKKETDYSAYKPKTIYSDYSYTPKKSSSDIESSVIKAIKPNMHIIISDDKKIQKTVDEKKKAYSKMLEEAKVLKIEKPHTFTKKKQETTKSNAAALLPMKVESTSTKPTTTSKVEIASSLILIENNASLSDNKKMVYDAIINYFKNAKLNVCTLRELMQNFVYVDVIESSDNKLANVVLYINDFNLMLTHKLSFNDLVQNIKEKCKNVNTISFKKVLYQTVLDYYDSFSNL